MSVGENNSGFDNFVAIRCKTLQEHVVKYFLVPQSIYLTFKLYKNTLLLLVPPSQKIKINKT